MWVAGCGSQARSLSASTWPATSRYRPPARSIIGEGEFYVVPKGTMHNPVADEECWLVLIETVTTKHTGDIESPLTKTIEEQLA